MKYYSIYGDSDDHNEFYFGRDKELQFEICSSCLKVINRSDAVEKALPFYKSKFDRILYTTWDGVTIVSDRFVEIYMKYGMTGLKFRLIPKLKKYHVLECVNIVRFDTTANPDFKLMKICNRCDRPNGAYRPFPYKIINEDESKLSPLTFYRSDIEFGDKHRQSPLLFVTEDIVPLFQYEGGRIFFESAENGKQKIIDCKKHSSTTDTPNA